MPSKNINPCGRLRSIDKPYEIWQSKDANWIWKVLKKKNDGLIWHCAVQSPNTYGSWEYGDVYSNQITTNSSRIYIDPEIDMFSHFRENSYHIAMDLPQHDGDIILLNKFEYDFLHNYFQENGMSYHYPNSTGDVTFLLSIEPEQIESIVDSPKSISISPMRENRFEFYLVIKDDPDNPLLIPFIFGLDDDQHRYEMVKITEQENLNFHVLSKINGEIYSIYIITIPASNDFQLEISSIFIEMFNQWKLN